MLQVNLVMQHENVDAKSGAVPVANDRLDKRQDAIDIFHVATDRGVDFPCGARGRQRRGRHRRSSWPVKPLYIGSACHVNPLCFGVTR